MAVLRVCYRQDVRFDEAYYVSKHLPLVKRVMGPHGLTSMEVMKVISAADGSKPLYQVMFSAHFASEAALRAAMQDSRMPEVLDEIQSFYDGMPEVFMGEVISVPA